MGTFPKGIFGSFRGKVGKLVGGKWKDVEILKTLPEGGTSNPSDLQLAQRAKFAMGVQFIKATRLVVSDIYRNYPKQMTAANKAVSDVLRTAITGVYPNFQIDYRKVTIATGSLRGVDDAVAVAEAPDKVKITWTDNSTERGVAAADHAILAVYCEELNRYSYSLSAGTRGQGTAILSVPAFSGKQVHTWLSFLSENGKYVAQSVYTGGLMVVR
jgi:hypothetical protein